MIDRKVFFDTVRKFPFQGVLAQSQVDGMNSLLNTWEAVPPSNDLRWLAYALATTFHETAQTMLPIEEYGKGEGYEYGEVDPETGQTYYGRGFVQLTWRDNYCRADTELSLSGDQSCEWAAANALDPTIASNVLYRGMADGWFRAGETLGRYFSETVDDPYGAREIINGDKEIVPEWGFGFSIGELIAKYHRGFLVALRAATAAAEEI